MQQHVSHPTDALPPRPRQFSRPDVELQRLVQQPGLRQPGIASLAPLDKLGLGRAGLEVLVLLLLLRDGGVGARIGAAAVLVASGGVVVAGVDLCGIGKGEELGDGSVPGKGLVRG